MLPKFLRIGLHRSRTYRRIRKRYAVLVHKYHIPVLEAWRIAKELEKWWARV